jgi:carboxyl-terminal processing protease
LFENIVPQLTYAALPPTENVILKTAIRNSIAVILLVTVLAGSHAFAADKTVPPVSSASAEMPLALRQQVLDQVWNAVDEKYYDPKFNGADWPSVRASSMSGLPAIQDSKSFYRYLNRMLASLRDTHTSATSPEQVALRKARQKTSIGASLAIDGTLMSVERGSEAEKAGLRPGMVITTIDDVSVADRARQLRAELIPDGLPLDTRAQLRLADRLVASRLLSGDVGSSIKLTVAGDNAAPFPVTLTRQLVSNEIAVESRILASGLGYIAFDGFKSKPLKQVRAALVQMKNAPGLIIDLRENGGGDFRAMVELADWFFDKPVPFGTLVTRTGKPLSFLGGLYKIPLRFDAGGPKKRLFSKPVVILISERSASASEYFSAAMRENGRAKLVGTLSCGCTNGAAGVTKLLDGGQLRIGNFGSRTPQGSITEGNGLEPDLVVESSVSDLKAGLDPALAAAEQMLVRKN